MSGPMPAAAPTRDAEWLPDAPAHWELLRLHHHVAVVAGATPSKGETGFWDGEIPWVSPKDMKCECLANTEDRITPEGLEAARLRLLPPGAVLAVVRGMILARRVPVAILGMEATINQDMRALLPDGRLDGRYLALMLRGFGGALEPLIEDAAHGTKRLRTDLLLRVRFPVPPLDEQRRIVAFLDRETARIDALVDAKERFLALLDEKRAALITRAVTRGLDPNTPMKPAGVPWLDQVPANWRIERLRFSLEGIEQGCSPQCDNRPAEDGEWGVLKVGCVNYGRFDPSRNKALPPDLKPVPAHEVRAGDVLMSRASGSSSLVGSCALVRVPPRRLLLSDKHYRLIVNARRAAAPFLVYSLNACYLREQIALTASSFEGMARNVSQEAVRDLVWCVPPLDEQRRITAWLETELAKLDKLRAKTERSIELLRERREALITAAVSGRIAVGGEVATAGEVTAGATEEAA